MFFAFGEEGQVSRVAFHAWILRSGVAIVLLRVVYIFPFLRLRRGHILSVPIFVFCYIAGHFG